MAGVGAASRAFEESVASHRPRTESLVQAARPRALKELRA